MLFDIRGRRKHVVRVVYAILALLMGASLFLVVGPFSIGNLVGNGGTTERRQGPRRNRPNGPNRSCAGNLKTKTCWLALTRARLIGRQQPHRSQLRNRRHRLHAGRAAGTGTRDRSLEQLPEADQGTEGRRWRCSSRSGYFSLAESSVELRRSVRKRRRRGQDPAHRGRSAADDQLADHARDLRVLRRQLRRRRQGGQGSGSQGAEQGRSERNRQTDGRIPQARQGLRSAEEGSRQGRKETGQRTPAEPPRRPVRRHRRRWANRRRRSGPCWARTSDLEIKSLLLYQLS